MVTSGSLRGQTGTIMRVDTKNDRVFIKGMNLRTKHIKPNRLNGQGGIVTREAGIHISNVSPVVDGKPTRVRFKSNADGSKVRVAASNGQELGSVRGPDAKKRTGAKAAAKK